MRLAVIGGGIAGMGATLILQQAHEVTLFEAEGQLGGHSRTREVAVDGKAVPVDTGFIVHNPETYPMLSGLFADLAVPTTEAPMTFAVDAIARDYGWCSISLRHFFRDTRSLADPAHWRLLLGMRRLFRVADTWLEREAGGRGPGPTMREWIADADLGAEVVDNFLLPMGAAIWSTPQAGILDFPARTMLRFFANHRLLAFGGQPRWRSVVGGSREYVRRLAARLTGPVVHRAVAHVTRDGAGVTVTDADGAAASFDGVVLACHADQALALLADPSAEEREVLGAVRYAANEAILHTDATLLPASRKGWASWVSNVCAPGEPASVSYWMNSLQRLGTDTPVVVSLNSVREPDPARVADRHTFHHPQFDAAAIAAQKRLPGMQGRRATWYCGAWTRHGFHEDGLWSAVQVGKAFGLQLPW